VSAAPDLVLYNGRIRTLDAGNPMATAAAVSNGKFVAVGDDVHVCGLADAQTRHIDLRGRAVLPGLIDNHLHLIRGGLNFNMEPALGRRSLSSRCNGDVAPSGGDHAFTAMGTRGGRVHRASVCREASADDCRAQRSGSGHARIPAAPL
jgi:predicted amidohydrolase YtcJ